MNFAKGLPDQVPDVGLAWWDAFFESGLLWLGVLTLIVTALGRLLGAMARMKAELAAIRKDTAATREQTENAHASAPYPNLRDNIDANHAENLANYADLKAWMQKLQAQQETIAQAINQIQQDNHRQEKDLGGVRAEVREDRREHNRLAERVTHLEAGREPGYRRDPGFHRKTPTEEDEDVLDF